jgi:hypothetical protein
MVTRMCGFCGKTFEVRASWVRKGSGKHCSRECNQATKRGPDRKANKDGYILIRVQSHPRALAGRFVYEHTLVMEKALGRFLAPQEEIHHINKITSDNRIENLHLCRNKTEHREIHRRLRITELGGDPDKDRICRKCRLLKPLSEFSPSSSYGKKVPASACKPCSAEVQRQRRLNRR